MKVETLIEEIRKLPQDQKLMVKAFVLAEVQNGALPKTEQPTLYELFSQSPFAKLDFEVPEPVRSPVRPVEL